MPTGSTGVTLFEGSSKLAAVTGTHVRVQGPFPPGKTSFQVVAQLPVTTGTLQIASVFPAAWEQPLFIMKKYGQTRLSSAQFIGQQDMPGQDAVMAGGNRLEAGRPFVITLTGLPHHSPTPRWVALSLAGLILVGGVLLLLRRPASSPQKDERKRLIARREKLFHDLVRLENDRRAGKGSQRYETRREELVAALERIYGALDADDAGPSGSADRSGVAA
jgi:hypothetical protein